MFGIQTKARLFSTTALILTAGAVAGDPAAAAATPTDTGPTTHPTIAFRPLTATPLLLDTGSDRGQAPAVKLAQAAGADRTATDNGYVYRIGAEDSLEITVRNEPELSGTRTVRPDGYIVLPLVGRVLAVGRTTGDLERELVERLSDVILDPSVEIAVTAPTGTFGDRIRVIGSAVAPQSFPYRDGITVSTILAEIGGFPATGSGRRAHILRPEGDTYRRLSLQPRRAEASGTLDVDRPLEPGDIIVVPESFIRGDVEFTPSIGVSQSYTDNVLLAPDGFEDDALITELIPGFTLDADTPRIQAAVDATVRLQALTLTDVDDFSVAPNATGTVDAELVENFFFVDAAAAITRQLIDPGRARSGANANIRNQQLIQTYRLSPFVQEDLGRFAILELRYTAALNLIEQDELAIDTPTAVPFGFRANDSFENRGRVRLSSGPSFDQLSWSLTGLWSNVDREDFDSQRRREAIGRVEYAFTQSFSVFAEGGYQELEGGGFGRGIDDPLYVGGFRWAPNDRLSLTASGGQRDGAEAYNGQLTYQVNEDLVVSVSYQERGAIDQERLVENLPDRPDDLDGADFRPDQFTLRGDPTRTETVRGQITGTIGLTTISANSSFQRRDLGAAGDGGRDEEILQGGLSLQRPITRDWRISASGQYVRRDFEAIDDVRPFRRTEDIFASGGLSYTGFRIGVLSLDYSYSTRDAGDAIGFGPAFQSFTENVVTLTLQKSF